MVGRKPILNRARHPRVHFEVWSIEGSKFNYSLMSGRRGRILTSQRGMINKWSKRSVKKKKGSLQAGAQPFEVVTSKPLGVRMGNGRGRPTDRSARLNRGSRLVTLYQVFSRPAHQLNKLVKKSNLRLRLISLYY